MTFTLSSSRRSDHSAARCSRFTADRRRKAYLKRPPCPQILVGDDSFSGRDFSTGGHSMKFRCSRQPNRSLHEKNATSLDKEEVVAEAAIGTPATTLAAGFVQGVS
jgi:hypothetical protein